MSAMCTLCVSGDSHMGGTMPLGHSLQKDAVDVYRLQPRKQNTCYAAGASEPQGMLLNAAPMTSYAFVYRAPLSSSPTNPLFLPHLRSPRHSPTTATAPLLLRCPHHTYCRKPHPPPTFCSARSHN